MVVFLYDTQHIMSEIGRQRPWLSISALEQQCTNVLKTCNQIALVSYVTNLRNQSLQLSCQDRGVTSLDIYIQQDINYDELDGFLQRLYTVFQTLLPNGTSGCQSQNWRSGPKLIQHQQHIISCFMTQSRRKQIDIQYDK